MKLELPRGVVLAAALAIAGLACSLPSLPSLPGAEEPAAVEGQSAGQGEPAQVQPPPRSRRRRRIPAAAPNRSTWTTRRCIRSRSGWSTITGWS